MFFTYAVYFIQNVQLYYTNFSQFFLCHAIPFFPLIYIIIKHFSANKSQLFIRTKLLSEYFFVSGGYPPTHCVILLDIHLTVAAEVVVTLLQSIGIATADPQGNVAVHGTTASIEEIIIVSDLS